MRDRNQGFTVLELILAAALGVVVLGGAYLVYEAGWSTVGRSERKADLQQNARAMLDTLVWQIRHAGYRGPSANPQLATWPDLIVMGMPNLLVLRGDVRTNGTVAAPAALGDTLFGIQPAGTGACPNPPAAYPVPGCLVTGNNVYTVAAAPAVLAFNVVTDLNFTYFDGAGNQLPTPLDNETGGGFTSGTPPPGPLQPPPTTCPASPLSIQSCRNSVSLIQIVLTAEDRNVSPGPGIGSEVERITLTANVRLRNNGLTNAGN